jgi:hypothetical protein
LIGVAVDVQGARPARRLVDASGATFPTVIDAENVLGALVGARAIPNGLFLDADGVVRYLKLGGFSVDEPADGAAIEALLAGVAPELAQVRREGPALAEADLTRSRALFADGTRLFAHGQVEEAVARWQAALTLNPDNWIIRKQIWAVRHPERFHPTIDWDWQKEQVARERQG